MNRTGFQALPGQSYAPPVPGLPLSQHVYAHIRAMIVTGEIAPSEALHEPTIAERFGVSRTPVREALLRLRDDGLVIIKKQAGTSVAPIDPARVEEGMLVREALEPRVAELAAATISERDLAALASETDLMADAVRSGDGRTFIEADDRFHRILVDAGGFQQIADIIGRVNAQLDRVRYLSTAQPIRSRLAVREHRALITSLRARDGAGVADRLRRHLQGSWVVIRAILSEQS